MIGEAAKIAARAFLNGELEAGGMRVRAAAALEIRPQTLRNLIARVLVAFRAGSRPPAYRLERFLRSDRSFAAMAGGKARN